jgi:hypothetical protein
MGNITKTVIWLWAGVLALSLPMRVDASVIASSTISLTALQIAAPGGFATFVDPPESQAFTNAFNSLGEAAADFDSATGADATASATVSFAEGSASASTSLGTLTALSLVTLPDSASAAAGVSSPGSLASLSGIFTLPGSGLVDVAVQMLVSGSLRGMSDALGRFRTDADASLEIDGAVVLFDLFELSHGAGFPDTTVPFATTLSAIITLDAGVEHFFFWNAHADTVGQRLSIPSTALLLASALALTLIAPRRARGVVNTK